MNVIDPGHKYDLDNLKQCGVTTIVFYKDPEINGEGLLGPSSQEYIRALIDRQMFLNEQMISYTICGWRWYSMNSVILSVW